MSIYAKGTDTKDSIEAAREATPATIMIALVSFCPVPPLISLYFILLYERKLLDASPQGVGCKA